RTFTVVDFPAPFGPMNATDSPAGTDNVTPLTADTSDTCLRKPLQRVSTKVFFRSSISTARCITLLTGQSFPRSGGPNFTELLFGFDSELGAGKPLPRS